ncbi:type II and III secretion system protein [Pseudodesulfovibrio mercurii]|uniref:Type II and III secretion system protein n=1 Tax=Pseudodesulfovibrio mercurii TaxID=641491 RepID=F0JJQ7_9BACT|nr:type II and III secretion system protein family protein [Pseudodesulfovibrio mercurii]EGB16156.1 type II and III secretion system protein [Pseudodesulfovibrio mercurii]
MKNARTIQYTLVVLLACLVVLTATVAWARVVKSDKPDMISMIIGESTVITTDQNVSRITLGSDTVCSIVVISPTQIYLTANEIGSTTLTLWTGDRVSEIYDIAVDPDTTRLKRMIYELLPQENNVRVLTSGNSITLSGQVSNATSLSSVLSLAEAAAPGRVVNLLSVDGIQQVMLEVRVAEMSRSVTKRLGLNFAAIGSNFSIYSIINNLTSYNNEDNVFELTDNINLAGSYVSGNTTIHGMVDALKSNGLVRMLAEPNLTCVSGEAAEFLVGGEVPIPMPSALGTVGIDYKPFGIALKFTATVMSSGRINLQVNPEVSELDYSKALSVSGYEIPTISTRRANTVVELGDGQSFVIAGLISDSLKENAHKFPGLGEVPVLGSLFSSKDFNSNKTELVVLVTAHLAKPVDMATQTLPTDGFREPDDREFYLFGLLEGQGGSSGSGTPKTVAKGAADPGTVIRPESGFDGEFGHSWPN